MKEFISILISFIFMSMADSIDSAFNNLISIDAIVVGFTLFNKLTSLLTLLVNCLLIGLITLLICTIGFYLCKFIKKINFISKYADFFGGTALIIFSFKMIFF